MLHNEFLLAIPESLKVKLRPIAESVVASVHEEGRGGIDARARALEAYLRDSHRFKYSLRMEVVDGSLDPVVDFLVNRKEGHCEYFASALALLLRSIDIPARMVNGFKGGDWNDITQTMNVRQKHAHSWVEAYIGTRGRELCPSGSRSIRPRPRSATQSVAKVGGIAGNFRTLTDLVRHIWVFYVIGYDGDRQSRLLYSPMRQMINWTKEKYFELGTVLRRGVSVLFRFEDIGSFISIRGFVVSFLVLTLLAGRGSRVDPPGSTPLPMVPRAGRRGDLVDGRHLLLPTAGPAAVPARSSPNAGRDAGRIRRPRGAGPRRPGRG